VIGPIEGATRCSRMNLNRQPAITLAPNRVSSSDNEGISRELQPSKQELSKDRGHRLKPVLKIRVPRIEHVRSEDVIEMDCAEDRDDCRSALTERMDR
jgi:hypothetical protein